MWIQRSDFIKNFQELVRKKLERELPEEDFEGKMLDDTIKIMKEWAEHMKGVVNND